MDGDQQLVPATSLICVNCGSTTPPGSQDINCDQGIDFQCTGITDDLGNEVKVWCINKSFYACLYIPKNGLQRFVGRCPFGGGRNSVRLFVINFIIDYHLRFHPNLLLLGMLGYNYLAGSDDLEGTHWWNFSFNIRYYPVYEKKVKPYVGFGPGYYKEREADKGRFGYNLSAGLDYKLSTHLDMEIGGDYHQIFTPGSVRKFMHFHIGFLVNL